MPTFTIRGMIEDVTGALVFLVQLKYFLRIVISLFVYKA